MSTKQSQTLGYSGGSFDAMQPLDAYHMATKLSQMTGSLSFGDKFNQMRAKSWLQKNPNSAPLTTSIVANPLVNTAKPVPFGIWNTIFK